MISIIPPTAPLIQLTKDMEEKSKEFVESEARVNTIP
jgi:hypothetical protein